MKRNRAEMSFLCGILSFRNRYNYTRKVKSSPGQQLLHLALSRIEKTSLLNGSMTVEAAVVLPVFLFFFMNLLASLEMIRLYGNLEYALHSAGNEVCLYGSLLTDPMKELGGTGHTGSSGSGGGTEESGVSDSVSDAGAEVSSGGGNPSQEDMDSILELAEGIALSYTYVRLRMIDELGEDYLGSSPLTSGTESLNYYGSTIDSENDIIAALSS